MVNQPQLTKNTYLSTWLTKLTMQCNAGDPKWLTCVERQAHIVEKVRNATIHVFSALHMFSFLLHKAPFIPHWVHSFTVEVSHHNIKIAKMNHQREALIAIIAMDINNGKWDEAIALHTAPMNVKPGEYGSAIAKLMGNINSALSQLSSMDKYSPKTRVVSPAKAPLRQLERAHSIDLDVEGLEGPMVSSDKKKR